jgi:NADH dehydrogenase/NADH:ubiquinone oxidoreductase subunit G
MESSSLGAVKAAFERAETSVCLTSHEHKLSSSADIVLPTAVIAEKGGSLTNVVGLAQSFLPAVGVLGDTRPEWKILVELAKRININFKYYSQFSSPESILEGMRKEIPDFGKKSD